MKVTVFGSELFYWSKERKLHFKCNTFSENCKIKVFKDKIAAMADTG